MTPQRGPHAGTPPDGRAVLIGSDVALVEAHDLALLDLDGVVYIGEQAVPGAPEALSTARRRGMRLCFVTNNASRPPAVVADHLTEIGVPAEPGEVMTSAMAAAAILAGRLPAGAAVLVVGGEGLYWALKQEGLTPVSSMEEKPAAVVQGFSPDIGWRLLAEGTRGVRSGLPWIATNTDLTFPTQYGPAPGNGALVAAIAVTTGIDPEVAGKPRPPLFLQAVRRYGAKAALVIGDRLDTDLEGARAANLPGLLVLTGVSGVVEVLAAAPARRPHFVGRDLGALFTPHPEPVPLPPGAGGPELWSCGQARVQVAEGPALLVQVPGDDAIDLFRAACGASWSWVDAATSAPVPDPSAVVAAMTELDGAGPWAR